VQIAVIGLGNFGAKLAETLHALGGEVIAVDGNEERVEGIKDRVSQAVCLDATDERALRAVGIAEVDVAVVAMSDVQPSILAATILKQIGITRVIARATSGVHERILREVGATQILRVEEQMAEQSAKWIIAPDILQHFAFSSGYSMVEVRPREEFVGAEIRSLGLRENYNLGIAALIKRHPTVDEEGNSGFKLEIRCPPDPSDKIERDDILALVGSDASILEFTEGRRE
jgi:trk system potassium uptake protein TrkA